MRSGASHSTGGVAIEGSRDTAGEGIDQPRTHCARCDKKLTRRQLRVEQEHCSRECWRQANNLTKTPEVMNCAFCGKPLTSIQRRGDKGYCSIGHANSHKRYPSQRAQWAEMNEYLETRDNWEKKAPRMTAPPESQKTMHIHEIIREEIQRGKGWR